MRIDDLSRYPVKGLSAESLSSAHLEPCEAIAWDRAFALAQGDSGFDPARPTFLPKNRFMCLMKNASIAKIQARFFPASGTLTLASPTTTLEENALTEPGRARIAAWLTTFLGPEARGTPIFHHVPGHVFGDERRPVVSLLNLASLASLEAACGAPRDPRRFRANITLADTPAWTEFDWIGRQIRAGTAILKITKRTDRCPATQVNPDTAERDANPMAELRAAFGHADLGVHAEIIVAGRIEPGDRIELL